MRLSTLAWVLVFATGCGSSAVTVAELKTTVPPPESKAEGSYELDFGPLDDQPVCSEVKGLEEICIAGLRSTMDQAIRAVLDRRFAGKGDAYMGRFRFTRFTHTKKQGETEVTFFWRFTLLSSQGEPALMLDERTTSPKRVKAGTDAEEVVEAGLQLVLDTIAETVNSTEL